MNTRQLPDHLSYSQISTYLTCPLRYKLQYVEQIPPTFRSAALAFGSAIHEAVGAFYHQHLMGDPLRPDQMLDVYRETWWNGDDTEIHFFNGDSESKLIEKAAHMLKVFHDAFDPSIVVLGVEEFFEFSIGDLPPFCGYVDLIEQDGEGKITVADLKTALLGEGSFTEPHSVVSSVSCECPSRPVVPTLGMAAKLFEMKPDVIHFSTCLASAKPGCPYTKPEELAQLVENETGIKVVLGRRDYH